MQFRDRVPRDFILHAWQQEGRFEDKHLWGVMANLVEYMPKDACWCAFMCAIKQKLQAVQQSPSSFSFFGVMFWTSYRKLSLEVRICVVNPKDVRFIQDSISTDFRERHLPSVHETTCALHDRTLSAHRIEPISVFEWNKNVHTADNRRLYAFQEAKLSSVPVNLTESRFVARSKFTTKNQGKRVQVRKGR